MKRPSKLNDDFNAIDYYTHLKELDKYIDFLENQNKQLTLGGVMPELLCVDNKDNNALTRHYTYKAISEDDTHYKVVDNYGGENWFLKEQLRLHAVSHQRELLTDFIDNVSTYDFECEDTDTIVSNYLDKVNCG